MHATQFKYFPLGKVVWTSNQAGLEDVGHVVGFDRNSHGELLIKVQWSTERLGSLVSSIHPSNLEFE